MISHLRFATANPHYKPPASLKGNQSIRNGQSDRTACMQQQLLGMNQSRSLTPAGHVRHLVTGDVPLHVGGRGHLEGSCLARNEGLLESQKQKRHRKRKNGDKGASDDDDDDMHGGSSSEEDEEDRKVWKPTSGIGMEAPAPPTKKQERNRAREAKNAPAPTPAHAASDATKKKENPAAESLEGLDGDIRSLARDELDWSKTSRFGKKSNENFQKWMDGVAKKMHDQQVGAEDTLFTQF